jgi:assimilatory nitrate reductase catalytic subunit
MLDDCGGIQWPWAADGVPALNGFRDKPDERPAIQPLNDSAPQTERRLFTDGIFFHPDGKAKFLFDEPRPVAEPTCDEFPFVLLTGRGASAQWHTGSRTNKSSVLRSLAPGNCYVEINPSDAKRLGIAPNTPVRICSRRASIEAKSFVTPTVQAGQIFIPMHYVEANRLTHASFDPHSRQPSYKHCAVNVERVD